MQTEEIRPFLVVQKYIPIPANYLEPRQYIYEYGIVVQVLKQENNVEVLFSGRSWISFDNNHMLYHRVVVKREETDFIDLKKESR
ncbi:hypothetical protein EQP59_09060 [Ornithobacterium rhinotracheale]|uniref:Uncharacterized protein n=1 Tax=Ornithobacterium rhinotracheale TaxID=28251 RepID=A0A410JTW1_ORNRH|nr:hypothetical protein [Ornithobacterium rhinotracheale]QAR31478.1 hypothetical protein EQP59_09060 [Ornithobacterium rhinotracheale]